MTFVHEDSDFQPLLGIVARETGIAAAPLPRCRRVRPGSDAAGRLPVADLPRWRPERVHTRLMQRFL